MASSALDKYCGSVFWDTALTWNTTDPDLTKCFEKTVLVWTPCIFLWIFSSLEVFYIVNSKNKDIPWNFLNVSKLLLNCLLIILSIADFATAIKFLNDDHLGVHNVDVYTPIVKILSFGLALVFLIWNKKHGLRTSGLLFIFWFLVALCSIPQFRTEIMDAGKETPDPYYLYVSYLIFFPVVVLLLILNCFVDDAPRYTENAKTKNPCPEENASFLNKLFFQWFDVMAWKGFKKPLENSDLWDMKYEDSAESVVPLFDKYWQQTVRKAAEKSSSQYPRAAFKSGDAEVEFGGSAKKKEASVLPALCKAFGPIFLFGSMLKLSQDIMTFVNPQILSLLINFVEKKEPQWKGFLYTALLFATAALQTLVLSQYFHRMFIVGMRIRTALISAIYRKALRMSNSAKKERTVGEIVNLMSVDAQKFIELTAYINMIWSAPVQIVLALYFLWQVLGPSVLAGLAVMIILIPVNAMIANRVKNLQIRQMKNKDERVKLMNEVLSGIKVLKLYAWEPSFESQILKIREKEIKVLKQAAYLNAGTSFIWSCAPFLVSLVTFGTYIYIDPEHVLTPQIVFVSLSLFCTVHFVMGVFPLIMVYAVEVSLVSFATFVLVDKENVLDAKTAFVSLSLFNVLRFPLSMLPMMISNMVQAWVSVKRINKFMNCEELDPDNVQHDPAEKRPIIIENGTFSWGEEPVLKNINVHFEKGSLTAVVGSVGSGKSSMISALLGEMDKVSGRVNTVGSIAYVSQQAWIQNATLQDNITFGKSLEKKTYDKVIESCALKPDFDMLPAGDQTEIGEKGINLSGGQKQRVSLARAVYSDSEIYLLDDPLSAVDSHVGKHIFDQVIGPTGVLKNTTRVLVTHGITYLPLVDKIIVLKDGAVSEVGNYKELLEKKGAFSEFLIQHFNEIVETEDDEHLDELKNQLSDTSMVEEFAKKFERHRSRVSESRSETGSEKANGTLQRQKSTDSTGERNLRQRSSSIESTKKEADKVGEKLIEAEKAETGSVQWGVYKHYLKSIGVFLSVTTILLNVLFQGFNIGSNIWLSIWSEDKEMTTGKRDMYLGVYGALGFGQGFSVVFISTCNAIGTLRVAKELHETLLKIVMRLPLSFFDSTPIGRILNRFSNDIYILDVLMLPILYMDEEIYLQTLALVVGGYQYGLATHKNVPFAETYGILSAGTDLLPRLGCWYAGRMMHNIMLGNLLRVPLSFFEVTPTGRILSRFSKDIDVLDSSLPFYIIDGVYCLFEVFATLFVISYTTPIFVAVIIPIGIVYCLIQRFYVATSRQLKRLESVSRSPIYSHFGETVTGSVAIRAYGVTDRFIKESEGKVDFNQISYYPSIIANRWLAVRLEMVGNLIILFAALFAVIDREQNPGLVGLSVTYALQITQSLNWLVRMTSDVETNIVAVERIKEYGETTQEAAWDIPNKTPAPSWPDSGAVVFENFAVRYRPGLDLVLKGINFSVSGGEKVGIVGRTGAGKSSLTLALFRIIEAAQGEILIDGINIAGIGLHALRSRLTIIPQDAVLFSGSLRMNLDPFDKHNDEEVWRSLEHAHLKEFVKGLPSGLNHEVTEGGENLSVGQRQLICLSRALLRKTKVLILDEATAAVDLETDDLIQRTIRTEFRDCTVLTIAHRLNTIMDSDRVIVLDKGYIVEFDSPQTLLQNRNTIFYGMAKDAGLA